MHAKRWTKTCILAGLLGAAVGQFPAPVEAVEGQVTGAPAHPQPAAAPVGADPELAWTQATGLDNLISALGCDMYFEANYPAHDFAPYLERLTHARDAAGQGDRHGVQADMVLFFSMLAARDHGISEGAAEELADFARIVMPHADDGVVVPRSGGGP